MNIVCNASAGTGKTYRVTELYEKLVLDDGLDPHRILLMTFTDNAAAELRMRVTHRLLKARQAAEDRGDMDATDRIVTALSHLPSAPIETIHSFCTRLLREHALEAGLSPGFSVFVGDERNELLERICQDELLERLESDPHFRTFCSGVQLFGGPAGFGTSISETVPRLIEEADSLGIPLDNAEALLPPPGVEASLEDFRALGRRIRALPRITPSVQVALDLLEQCLDESEDVESLVRRLAASGIKKFGRGEANVISHALWNLMETVEDAVRYRGRHEAARSFARYLQAVWIRFQQNKHAMDAVDFGDQLRLAGRLLETGRAAPEFKYVIVDEVQDTSRVQCDIIEALCRPAGPDRPAASLVICGDRKQSIYTWRGADPKVMPDLEKAIRATGNYEADALQTSYRSKSPILEVINRLFQEVYGPEHYTGHDHLKSNPGYETAGEDPCIEFLQPDEDVEDLHRQEKVAAEMDAVADRIRLLVGDPDGPPEDPAWRPHYRFDGTRFAPVSGRNRYRYSDILILLRRTAHQSSLEHALREAGIPYTLGGKGRGLFTRQETRDVSLFLNVITNPSDALSLIGFLRSPWVGLSDEVIAELAWSEGGFSVDRLMSNYTRETDIVERYRAQLGTRLASELVRMLIDETAYDALLAGLPRGTQRLANLKKVLDWLRENERGARITPAGAARRLADRIARPPQVPEAALLDPAQNAVTVMTVHSAKGLTRRVVFVPDLSASTKQDAAFARLFFDKEKKPRLGVKVTAPDRSAAKSPGFEAARRDAQAERVLESMNLFYVAMTRARDLVVTSATVGRSPAGWYKEMEHLIGNEIPAISYTALREAAGPPQTVNPGQAAAAQLAAAVKTLAPSPAIPVLQRMPATRLAKETVDKTGTGRAAEPLEHASALGSLGHAVLEQLALNEWTGSVEDWLGRLHAEFAIAKPVADALAPRIEQTRTFMAGLTAGVQELRPELPFVLHDGNRLIDGTIDLLCRGEDQIQIYDYKFTDADDAAVLETYRGQMDIYGRAAGKAYPETGQVRLALVVVAAGGVRLVQVPAT
jgi:ATP-dependent helicase/nuclease subunit A